MLVKIEKSEDFILSRWGAMHISQTDQDTQQVGGNVVTLFDNGVRVLGDSKQMPNPAINHLMLLFWRLVGNKITPSALAHQVPTLSFWAEIKATASLAVVMVPWKWDEMCVKDRWMQLGGLVFVASQACDYFHGKMSTVSDLPVITRAQAFEAEYLLTLLKEPRIAFKPNDYQKMVLDKFPKGLESLPKELRYQMRPVEALPPT